MVVLVAGVGDELVSQPQQQDPAPESIGAIEAPRQLVGAQQVRALGPEGVGASVGGSGFDGVAGDDGFEDGALGDGFCGQLADDVERSVGEGVRVVAYSSGR